jgi:hypothetical protein
MCKVFCLAFFVIYLTEEFFWKNFLVLPNSVLEELFAFDHSHPGLAAVTDGRLHVEVNYQVLKPIWWGQLLLSGVYFQMFYSNTGV